MIRKYILIVTLVFMSCPVFAQWSMKVDIIDTMVYRVDTNMEVFMSLNIPKDSVQKDYEVIITPVLYNGDSCIELNDIGIYGKEMKKVRRREIALAGKKYTEDVAYKMEVDNIFTYWVSVPVRSWMDTVSFLWEERIRDCCDHIEVSFMDIVMERVLFEDRAIPNMDIQEKQTIGKEQDNVNEEKLVYIEPTDSLTLPGDSIPPEVPRERERWTMESLRPVEVKSFAVVDTALAYRKPVSVGETKKMDIKFLTSKKDIDFTYKNNFIYISEIIKQFDSIINSNEEGSVKIRVIGSCSPDGPEPVNYRLANDRAYAFCESVVSLSTLDSSYFQIQNIGENWGEFRRFVEGSDMSFKYEILEIIDDNSTNPDQKEKLIKALDNGSVYKYLNANCFPDLRKIEYKIIVYGKEE